MAAEKPDSQGGCQLSRKQLASRIDQHEAMLQKAFLHISKLEKEVDSIKKERDFYKDTVIRMLSVKPDNNGTPAEEEHQQIRLPEQLDTEKAHVLWEKLKAANLIDDHYQPLVSAAKAAMIANAMGIRLHINVRYRWKDFQLLWHRRYMSCDLVRAQKSDFYDSFFKVIESILGSENQ